MEESTSTAQDNQPKDTVQAQAGAQDGSQADGYYGEDELEMDELDLSFLDEEDDEDAEESGKADKADKAA